MREVRTLDVRESWLNLAIAYALIGNVKVAESWSFIYSGIASKIVSCSISLIRSLKQQAFVSADSVGPSRGDKVSSSPSVQLQIAASTINTAN